MAICSYAATGQLLDGAGAGGSVVMFAVPKEKRGETHIYGERSLSETVLHTVSIHDLMGTLTRRIPGGQQGHSGPAASSSKAPRENGADDIMAVATEILQSRVERLTRLVWAGRVCIDVRLGSLSPSDQVLLDEVRRLQPYTMSWSNVLDYVEVREGPWRGKRRSKQPPFDN